MVACSRAQSSLLHLASRSEFLSLGTTGILCPIILCHGAVLCIVGCLAAPVFFLLDASSPCTPTPLSCAHQNCIQTLWNVPWGGKNHLWLRTTYVGELNQPHGFKCHLGADEPQIHTPSSDPAPSSDLYIQLSSQPHYLEALFILVYLLFATPIDYNLLGGRDLNYLSPEPRTVWSMQ